ncbi:TIGR04141 family sporadically distributed protein [Paeniglutamicibacter sulfureus]|uniref:DUF6119 family protein n=1 Tax=Paeniglutamicibacter sulfureus TaxID=43666 RepID=UPI002666BD87|nr:DUF6119 family protein [Paeniglutamicibacter sulfureus]MDO2935546.1 TIGR04141 family sporadically distributed protein [Paeniglutamicibacter sulfureus]
MSSKINAAIFLGESAVTKSRSFSVYLLKKGFNASSALKDDHSLTPVGKSSGLPVGWKMYLFDPQQRQPWWRDYFGLSQDLSQSVKGALVFLSAEGRNFAISLGPAHFSLKDESYEYDFGLLVTLNCVDPTLIRNTDVLEPGSARRQRTQLASRSDLTYFDFDGDNSILRTLTGNIRTEYEHLFKFATGASNLRISSSASVDELEALCGQILDIYKMETYKSAFPGIRNITPVRDPDEITRLDVALIQAIRIRDDHVALAVPAIVDYQDNFWVRFGGLGASLLHPDVDISDYYKYVSSNGLEVETLNVVDLKHHELRLANDDGATRDKYSIYKSLVFDTKLASSAGTYYLSEASWYQVEDDFIADLRNHLDARYEDLWLPDCSKKPEAAYNQIAADSAARAICLDKTNMSPKGQTALEPCDIYSVRDGRAVLSHIKIGTSSGDLSHLFNQGANAVQLLRSSEPARERLVKLIQENGGSNEDAKPVENRDFLVEYGIISRKNPTNKSDNLPLFSRISLKRALEDLELMGAPASFGFISDKTPRDQPKVKKRQPRQKTG